MKNLLFYDTKTTGLPAWSDPSDAPHQPHLVQLAAKVVDPKTPKLTEAYEHLIGKPMEGAHSADGDVDGCIAVYFVIQERTQHATA